MPLTSPSATPTAPADPAAQAPVIEARGLTVTLDATPIVRGIDLAIPTGQMVALLGANGSGKSTTIKALLGILPHEGRAALFGQTEHRLVPWSRVGYVPQRSTAGAGVPTTAEEVVASGLLFGRRLRLPRHARARARDALAEVGLADRARDAVAELSGGQQQRVLIARALVRDPDLLVLDEPTAGVDLGAQEDFVAAIAARRAATGLTVLVVLHETGSYASLIDRAVVLRDGIVVYDGDPSGIVQTDPFHPASAHLHDPHHPLGDPHHAHTEPEPEHAPELEFRP